MKDYYELLEVNNKASKEIIEKVYKLHIKKNHPDLFQGEEKENAEILVKELNEAYEILSDDIKRKEYDSTLKEENTSQMIEKNIYDEVINENIYLKQQIKDKEQIIEHFLGDLDLSEMEDIQQQRHEINSNNNENIEQNINVEKTSIFKYYLSFLSKISNRIIALVIVLFASYYLVKLLFKL